MLPPCHCCLQPAESTYNFLEHSAGCSDSAGCALSVKVLSRYHSQISTATAALRMSASDSPMWCAWSVHGLLPPIQQAAESARSHTYAPGDRILEPEPIALCPTRPRPYPSPALLRPPVCAYTLRRWTDMRVTARGSALCIRISDVLPPREERVVGVASPAASDLSRDLFTWTTSTHILSNQP